MTTLEICDQAGLDEEARQMAAPDLPVRAYIETLARGERVGDSVRALAQVLPNGDAIAWGLHSIRRVSVAISGPKAAAALRAVDEWLADANDERRRAAHQAAEQAGIGTPAGCLAFAVFLSGGSMAPEEAPVAPEPAPHLCGRIVAGAMSLAVAMDPRNAPQLLRSFLDHGLHLAGQLKVWEEKG
jgi:hypothetical protein